MPEVQYLKGLVYFKKNTMDKAYLYFKNAEKYNYSDNELYVYIANSAYYIGKIDEAETYYLKALEEYSPRTGIFYNLGNLYLKKKDYQLSAIYFLAFINEGGGNSDDLLKLENYLLYNNGFEVVKLINIIHN
ncbi:MAG: Stage V sporulation protein K [Candidatus Roizmanbacteria bacterium GW2011_GWC2_41_7]|uniref:Stage V sporulation protein K n=1 Tax=Candidatus Roizmanbacteria bacterium GW2011_GWC2_41_7 TaxID=1618487 RepID=A0A0G0XAH6_9BACT|nr:MAG: Stage V sporulation protein K [Candidatus Roizmanbacteria bacterium GW2011_GWC2_41_7]